MTEREKMLSGRLYRADDPELTAMHRRARALVARFNALPAEDDDGRRAVLREPLGAQGEHCAIEPPFHCDYGCFLRVGENFYANAGLTVLDCAAVTIGAETSGLEVSLEELLARALNVDGVVRCEILAG